MKVADIIERKEGHVVTVASGTSLSDVTRELSRHNIGALLVLDENDAIAGIVSERDIVRHIAAEGKIEPTATVDDVMARDVRTCNPSDDVVDVMREEASHSVLSMAGLETGDRATFDAP